MGCNRMVWIRNVKDMLNVLWPIFIIISFIYAILFGNVEEVNNGIFSSLTDAVQLSITFLGTMCFWNGIMQIARHTSFVDKLVTILKPIMRILFPGMRPKDKAYQEISMNMVANILGLGNAATPLGMKAMKTLQEENPKKDTVTNTMAMFIILNTASIQLIPTNVIAIRTALGSENASGIIFPVWIATLAAAFAGIVVTKICIAKSKKRK